MIPPRLRFVQDACGAAYALVQHTLYPPRLPRKTLTGVGSAGSSTTGSAQACTSGATRPAQKRSSAPSPSGQSGKEREGPKGSAPFSSSSGGSGCSGDKGRGSGKSTACQAVSPFKGRGFACPCTGCRGRQ